MKTPRLSASQCYRRACEFVAAMQPEKAIPVLREGVNNYPESSKLAYSLGKRLEVLGGHDEEAARHYGAAYSLSDSHTVAMDLVKILTKLERHDMAEAILLDRYRHREDRDPTILLITIAKHYENRGMMDLALACYHHVAWCENAHVEWRNEAAHKQNRNKTIYGPAHWHEFEQRAEIPVPATL